MVKMSGMGDPDRRGECRPPRSGSQAGQARRDDSPAGCRLSRARAASVGLLLLLALLGAVAVPALGLGRVAGVVAAVALARHGGRVGVADRVAAVLVRHGEKSLSWMPT